MPSLHSLSFIWPSMLWMLLLVPLLVALYIFVSTQYRTVSSLNTFSHTPQSAQAIWPRHITAAILFLGIGLTIVSLARPKALILLPTRMDSVMLAIDTSGSMGATDTTPNRIEAAQSAIKKFIAAQPPQVKLGVVTIASTAALAQSPTSNRDDLYKILDTLPLQAGSALGSGILIALSELIPGKTIDIQKILTEADRPSPPTDTGRPLDMTPRLSSAERVAPGSNKSFAIVLLSDGQNNFGPDPVKMAQIAADYGVRIFTIGLGTPEGIVLKAQGISMRVKLDEATLKKIADISHGDYYRAANDQDIKKIYDSLSTTLRLEKHQTTEVTAIFLALGTLLILLASMISLRRSIRIL